jgi:hypothetical protein
MVADVQQWLDQPSNNLGWGLIASNSEHVVMTTKRFDTKENADASLQPSLTVTYLPPAP